MTHRSLVALLSALALAGCPELKPDEDGDGFTPESDDPARVDCDDTDATVNPEAVELCDDIDHDCDGETWNGLEIFEWQADADGDGFGVGTVISDCAVLDGHVAAGGVVDCDDTSADVSPASVEACNGIDDDCDGAIDQGFDGDGDGFVDGADESCIAGMDPAELDCDDADDEIFPGAPERCNDLDDDCDGAFTDEEDDTDEDGHAPCDGDCNDNLASISPAVLELCDGVDTDCDGVLGAGEVDEDGDLYLVCGPPYQDHGGVNPGGFEGGEDCDDAVETTFPGADEACNGVDEDCDGRVDEDFDADSDGFVTDADLDGDGTPDCEAGGYDAAELDCDDASQVVFPGGPEVCDGLDSDCDGDLVDGYPDVDGDGEPDCTDVDVDGDGDPAITDCDDLDPAVFTGAPELCDDVDSDCDGDLVDDAVDTDLDGEPDCVDLDDDNDLFPDDVDCEPLDPTFFPNAPELCDDLDSDCDGTFADEFSDFDGDDDPDCTDADDDNDGDPDVTDCKPTNADIYNGAPEIPDDFLDQDCDGADTVTCFVDGDGDGVGVPANPTLEADGLCGDELGESQFDNDCNDGDPTIHPGADELCDSVDSNCNGERVDQFPDQDGDGDPDCIDGDTDGDGFTIGDGDCDDLNNQIFPGAPEVCDGIDNDCDLLVDAADDDATVDDFDGDGDAGPACGGEDCNDNDAAVNSFDDDLDEFSPCQGDCDDTNGDINPAEDEQPYDGIDQDCSGGDLTDVDNDLHDSPLVGGDDCNDDDPYVHPNHKELCDGVDNDCDGDVDLDDSNFDFDGDNDGFATDGCGSEGADCDDRDPHVFPSGDYTSGVELECAPAVYPGYFSEFHFARISLPHLFIDPDSGQQYLYFRGHEDQDEQSIGYSSSADGEDWSAAAGPVLQGRRGEWDESNISNPTVVRVPDSEGLARPYVMLYHAKDASNLRQIGLVSATDPEGPWERLSPVDGTTDVLDPVLPPSPISGHGDDNRTLHPSLRWDDANGEMELWYNARSAASSTLRVFHATSTDYGLSWTRTDVDAVPGADIVLEPVDAWEGNRTTQISWLETPAANPGSPDLLFWYTADEDDKVGFAEGTSTDWTRSPMNPVLLANSNCKRFDGEATSARGIRYDEGEDLFHWYYGATTQVLESNPSAPCPLGNWDPVYGRGNAGNRASYIGHGRSWAPDVVVDSISATEITGTVEDTAPDLVVVEVWQDAAVTGMLLGAATVAPTGNTDPGLQTTTWSLAVTLPSGSTTIVARAVDQAGIVRDGALTATVP